MEYLHEVYESKLCWLTNDVCVTKSGCTLDHIKSILQLEKCERHMLIVNMSTNVSYCTSQNFYKSVKNEVLNSVRKLDQDYARWQVLARDPRDNIIDFESQHAQVLNSLRNIDWDLNDLVEATRVLQNNRQRFPDVTDAELKERLRFVEDMRSKISMMQTEVNDPKYRKQQQNNALKKEKTAVVDSYSKLNDDKEPDAFYNQIQEMQRQEDVQEVQLDQLGRVITKVKDIAVKIGDEVKRQDEVINRLDNEMDNLGNKLKNATKKMEKLLKDSQDRKKIFCVFILVVVLIIVIALFFAL
jgi:syntaxin 6